MTTCKNAKGKISQKTHAWHFISPLKFSVYATEIVTEMFRKKNMIKTYSLIPQAAKTSVLELSYF